MQRDYFNLLTTATYYVHIVEIIETNVSFDSDIVKGLIWQNFR